jgi:hypothetical protein
LRHKLPDRSGGLLAAALALPGLAATLAQPAHADAPPPGEFDLRLSHYQDFQPGAERIRVNTPSLFVLLPAGADWAVGASYTNDSISGASPLFHNTLSGASRVGVLDIRRAGDLEATRYFERGTLSFGAARSNEDDYNSNALRIKGTRESADHNLTWSFGLGASFDRIDSVNHVARGEKRDTLEAQFGVSRVLTPVDLVSASVTFSHGDGYYSDPYKPFDTRPDSRGQTALLLRYNHYLRDWQSALRMSYRWYGDSWDVRAHTFEAAWEKSFGAGWSLTPSLRYYTQSRARFYFDPPFLSGFQPGADYSADTRLSAFGAFTAGLQLNAPLGHGWSSDFKFDFYRQESGWRIFGNGSPGLEPLSARIFELGVRRAL